MKAGTIVRAIHAPELSIPITEGEIYTVSAYSLQGNVLCDGDGSVPSSPAIKLVEVAGCFRADRFEPA